ncbi:hypothetical protein P3T39_006025 [Kitasatospora sp. GP82]|nr:hypothetical protein [Kitasatospora sp. GP82]
MPIQFTGDTNEQADAQAYELLQALGRDEDDPAVALSDDPAREHEMLKAREAGLGVTARPPDGSETWEGWEDSAVAPEKLGAYLRDLERLFDRYGYQQASLYGHFGQGCVHTRIPFELREGKGVEAFRAFLFEAADLVASYGGSLSGEHGDGQARGVGRGAGRGGAAGATGPPAARPACTRRSSTSPSASCAGTCPRRSFTRSYSKPPPGSRRRAEPPVTVLPGARRATVLETEPVRAPSSQRRPVHATPGVARRKGR